MQHRVNTAIVCLHIGAALYILICFGAVFWISTNDEFNLDRMFMGLLLAFSLVIGAALEWIIIGLKRRRFWAWIAAICAFALFLPSAFLPLGAIGLWALLSEGTRTEFGFQPQKQDR